MQKDVLWAGDTAFGRYEIVDTFYDGRPARVLYSGDRQAAQSGMATDDEPDLLFDYIQRMYELVMNLSPKKVLIIGGGTGTLATALLWAMPSLRIDMIEPDEGVTKLAYEYFNLPVDERLRIFATDGRGYLNGTTEQYDMILVDAFMHTTVPEDLKTLEAFQAFHTHLQKEGVVVMNVISGYYGPSAKTLRQLYAAACQTFDVIDIFLASRGYTLWLPQNFVLTMQKGSDLPLKDYVRHAAVQPLEVFPDEALHDA